MKKKPIFLTALLIFNVFQTYAQSVSEFKSGLKTLNQTTILPLLGAGIGIYALISGIMRIGKIRKGGEEQTDAIMNWLGSLIWPVVVVIVAEAIVVTFSVFGG
jgi:hypothetical protein